MMITRTLGLRSFLAQPCVEIAIAQTATTAAISPALGPGATPRRG